VLLTHDVEFAQRRRCNVVGKHVWLRFEHFVRQLFEARGLKGWTTERTADDRVDASSTATGWLAA
jgi:hypothetical protein